LFCTLPSEAWHHAVVHDGPWTALCCSRATEKAGPDDVMARGKTALLRRLSQWSGPRVPPRWQLNSRCGSRANGGSSRFLRWRCGQQDSPGGRRSRPDRCLTAAAQILGNFADLGTPTGPGPARLDRGATTRGVEKEPWANSVVGSPCFHVSKKTVWLGSMGL